MLLYILTRIALILCILLTSLPQTISIENENHNQNQRVPSEYSAAGDDKNKMGQQIYSKNILEPRLDTSFSQLSKTDNQFNNEEYRNLIERVHSNWFPGSAFLESRGYMADKFLNRLSKNRYSRSSLNRNQLNSKAFLNFQLDLEKLKNLNLRSKEIIKGVSQSRDESYLSTTPNQQRTSEKNKFLERNEVRESSTTGLSFLLGKTSAQSQSPEMNQRKENVQLILHKLGSMKPREVPSNANDESDQINILSSLFIPPVEINSDLLTSEKAKILTTEDSFKYDQFLLSPELSPTNFSDLSLPTTAINYNRVFYPSEDINNMLYSSSTDSDPFLQDANNLLSINNETIPTDIPKSEQSSSTQTFTTNKSIASSAAINTTNISTTAQVTIIAVVTNTTESPAIFQNNSISLTAVTTETFLLANTTLNIKLSQQTFTKVNNLTTSSTKSALNINGMTQNLTTPDGLKVIQKVELTDMLQPSNNETFNVTSSTSDIISNTPPSSSRVTENPEAINITRSTFSSENISGHIIKTVANATTIEVTFVNVSSSKTTPSLDTVSVSTTINPIEEQKQRKHDSFQNLLQFKAHMHHSVSDIGRKTYKRLNSTEIQNIIDNAKNFENVQTLETGIVTAASSANVGQVVSSSTTIIDLNYLPQQNRSQSSLSAAPDLYKSSSETLMLRLENKSLINPSAGDRYSNKLTMQAAQDITQNKPENEWPLNEILLSSKNDIKRQSPNIGQYYYEYYNNFPDEIITDKSYTNRTRFPRNELDYNDDINYHLNVNVNRLIKDTLDTIQKEKKNEEYDETALYDTNIDNILHNNYSDTNGLSIPSPSNIPQNIIWSESVYQEKNINSSKPKETTKLTNNITTTRVTKPLKKVSNESLDVTKIITHEKNYYLETSRLPIDLPHDESSNIIKMRVTFTPATPSSIFLPNITDFTMTFDSNLLKEPFIFKSPGESVTVNYSFDPFKFVNMYGTSSTPKYDLAKSEFLPQTKTFELSSNLSQETLLDNSEQNSNDKLENNMEIHYDIPMYDNERKLYFLNRNIQNSQLKPSASTSYNVYELIPVNSSIDVILLSNIQGNVIDPNEIKEQNVHSIRQNRDFKENKVTSIVRKLQPTFSRNFKSAEGQATKSSFHSHAIATLRPYVTHKIIKKIQTTGGSITKITFAKVANMNNNCKYNIENEVTKSFSKRLIPTVAGKKRTTFLYPLNNYQNPTQLNWYHNIDTGPTTTYNVSVDAEEIMKTYSTTVMQPLFTNQITTSATPLKNSKSLEWWNWYYNNNTKPTSTYNDKDVEEVMKTLSTTSMQTLVSKETTTTGTPLKNTKNLQWWNWYYNRNTESMPTYNVEDVEEVMKTLSTTSMQTLVSKETTTTASPLKNTKSLEWWKWYYNRNTKPMPTYNVEDVEEVMKTLTTTQTPPIEEKQTAKYENSIKTNKNPTWAWDSTKIADLTSILEPLDKTTVTVSLTEIDNGWKSFSTQSKSTGTSTSSGNEATTFKDIVTTNKKPVWWNLNDATTLDSKQSLITGSTEKDLNSSTTTATMNNLPVNKNLNSNSDNYKTTIVQSEINTMDRSDVNLENDTTAHVETTPSKYISSNNESSISESHIKALSTSPKSTTNFVHNTLESETDSSKIIFKVTTSNVDKELMKIPTSNSLVETNITISENTTNITSSRNQQPISYLFSDQVTLSKSSTKINSNNNHVTVSSETSTTYQSLEPYSMDNNITTALEESISKNTAQNITVEATKKSFTAPNLIDNTKNINNYKELTNTTNFHTSDAMPLNKPDPLKKTSLYTQQESTSFITETISISSQLIFNENVENTLNKNKFSETTKLKQSNKPVSITESTTNEVTFKTSSHQEIAKDSYKTTVHKKEEEEEENKASVTVILNIKSSDKMDNANTSKDNQEEHVMKATQISSKPLSILEESTTLQLNVSSPLSPSMTTTSQLTKMPTTTENNLKSLSRESLETKSTSKIPLLNQTALNKEQQKTTYEVTPKPYINVTTLTNEKLNSVEISNFQTTTTSVDNQKYTVKKPQANQNVFDTSTKIEAELPLISSTITTNSAEKDHWKSDNFSKTSPVLFPSSLNILITSTLTSSSVDLLSKYTEDKQRSNETDSIHTLTQIPKSNITMTPTTNEMEEEQEQFETVQPSQLQGSSTLSISVSNYTTRTTLLKYPISTSIINRNQTHAPNTALTILSSNSTEFITKSTKIFVKVDDSTKTESSRDSNFSQQINQSSTKHIPSDSLKNNIPKEPVLESTLKLATTKVSNYTTQVTTSIEDVEKTPTKEFSTIHSVTVSDNSLTNSISIYSTSVPINKSSTLEELETSTARHMKPIAIEKPSVTNTGIPEDIEEMNVTRNETQYDLDQDAPTEPNYDFPKVLNKSTRVSILTTDTTIPAVDMNNNLENFTSEKNISDKETIANFSKSAHVEKTKCNYTNANANCVCDVEEILLQMANLSSLENPSNFLKSINTLTCNNYNQVKPNAFVITNDSLARYSDKILKRQLLHNYHKSRFSANFMDIKKTLNSSINLQSTNDNLFAFLGSQIEINCVPLNDMSLIDKESLVDNEEITYTWYKDSLPIIGTRIFENNGVLDITKVVGSDQGNFSCFTNAKMDAETSISFEDLSQQKFDYHVNVIDFPKYTYLLHIVYRTEYDCQDQDLEVISIYLPNIIQNFLCGKKIIICNVDIRNSRCAYNEVMNKKLLSVNVLIYITDSSKALSLPNYYNVNTKFAVHNKISVLINENLPAVMNTPVYFRLAYRQAEFYPEKIQHGLSKIQLQIGCSPGFHLNTSYCVPCPVGHYSSDFSGKCLPCLPGTFQPMLGSKSCNLCTHPFQPGCYSMFTRRYSFLMLVSLAVIVTTFLTLGFTYFYLRRNKTNYKKSVTYKNTHYTRIRDPEIATDMERKLYKRKKKYDRASSKDPSEELLIDKTYRSHLDHPKEKIKRKSSIIEQPVPNFILKPKYSK